QWRALPGVLRVPPSQALPRRAPGYAVALGTVIFAAAAGLVSCRQTASVTTLPPSGSASARAMGVPEHRPITEAELAQYAGSAACVRCHPQEGKQLATRHATTLARFSPKGQTARFRTVKPMHEPVLDLTY